MDFERGGVHCCRHANLCERYVGENHVHHNVIDWRAHLVGTRDGRLL